MQVRRVPGTGIDLTIIAFEVTPPGGIERLVDAASLVRPWRAAFDLGVRAVEGVWLAPAQEGIERALGGESGKVPTAVVLGIDGFPVSPDRSEEPEEASAPARIRLVRRPSRLTLEKMTERSSKGRGRDSTAREILGATWPTIAEAEVGVPDAVDHGVPVLAFPVNLTEYQRARPLCERARDGGAGVIALDPFAGGRLDGSFLEPPDGLEPAFRPEALEAMARRLAPVRELGFLTAGRRRTLAEAALRGVLDLPAVMSASVSFRSPRIEATVGHLPEVPSLSRSDVDELERLRRSPP